MLYGRLLLLVAYVACVVAAGAGAGAAVAVTAVAVVAVTAAAVVVAVAAAAAASEKPPAPRRLALGRSKFGERNMGPGTTAMGSAGEVRFLLDRQGPLHA